MHHITLSHHATIRTVSASESMANYITKEIHPEASLSVVSAHDIEHQEQTPYSRMYFVLEGEMSIHIENQNYVLKPKDSIFISKNTRYSLQGSFEAVVINQPAFGS